MIDSIAQVVGIVGSLMMLAYLFMPRKWFGRGMEYYEDLDNAYRSNGISAAMDVVEEAKSK